MNLLNLLGKRRGRDEFADPELTQQTVNDYNRTRSVGDRSLLCHAPFSNMYFNTEGHVALCWKTFHRYEVYSEDRTLMEIWNGPNFKQIREGVRQHALDYGCAECKKHLLEGNYVNVLSKAYDNEHLHPELPTIMEFELSNRCNLGCTMCNGNLSSTIRKDREMLPPLASPYGDKFVNELRGFIPHLREARFNGGEPFLIKIYYDIWDEVLRLNPGLRMVIATNGTVLTRKVREYMDRCNFHFNISVDGLSPETYESIRVGGNFAQLMENIGHFRDYCRANDRNLCIMVNPMRQNWWEMPDFVNWCNANDMHIWFNTIVRPAEQALWSLPADELRKIHHTLSAAKVPMPSAGRGAIHRYNIQTYRNLVDKQIRIWLEEAEDREHKGISEAIRDDEPLRDRCRKRIAAHMGKSRSEHLRLIMDRLEGVEGMLGDPTEIDDMYRVLIGSSPEVILDLCRELTPQQLVERFREYLLKGQ